MKDHGRENFEYKDCAFCQWNSPHRRSILFSVTGKGHSKGQARRKGHGIQSIRRYPDRTSGSGGGDLRRSSGHRGEGKYHTGGAAGAWCDQ